MNRLDKSRLLHWTASVALHLLVLACILPRHPEVAPMRLPGTARGSHIEIAYLPGRAPLQTAVPDRRSAPTPTPPVTPQPKLASPVPKPAPASPNASSPSTAQPDSLTGADALGDGNVSIALATFFPRPRPDLSSLAHGTAGDVILDIVIDSNGKVASTTVTHSLSPSIDQTVIATVQQWTFHPATRDGQSIASEQELHFHYERG